MLRTIVIVAALAFVLVAGRDVYQLHKNKVDYSEAEMKLIDEARSTQDEIDKVSIQFNHDHNNLEVKSHKEKLVAIADRNKKIADAGRGFWGKVMAAHPFSAHWFHAHSNDEDILSYLTSVNIADIPADDGSENALFMYRVIFEFAQNPYFSDRSVWRDIRGQDYDLSDSKDHPVTSGVHWVQSKMPTETSFMSYFEDPSVRKALKLDEHTISEISNILRYELWPSPFTYYDHHVYGRNAYTEEVDENGNIIPPADPMAGSYDEPQVEAAPIPEIDEAAASDPKHHRNHEHPIDENTGEEVPVLDTNNHGAHSPDHDQSTHPSYKQDEQKLDELPESADDDEKKKGEEVEEDSDF